MASKSDSTTEGQGWWEEGEFEILCILLQVLNHNRLANNALKDKLTAFDSWQSIV